MGGLYILWVLSVISCRVDLMVTNSFSFCVSGKLFLLLFGMKALLDRIFGCLFFPFRMLNISCHFFLFCHFSLNRSAAGQPWWHGGLAPPAAQGMILESRDRFPRQALCMEPASPSACVSASLSLCISMNK